MGLISRTKKKVYEAAEKKAKELYSKASPAVQKDIDKFIASKAKDVLKYIPYVIGAGMLVYAMYQNSTGKTRPNYGADDWKSLSFTYNDIHNTYNYYKEK